MSIQEALHFIHRGLITWNILWFFILFFHILFSPGSFWKLHLPIFTSVLEKYNLETRKHLQAVRKWNSLKGHFDFSKDYFAEVCGIPCYLPAGWLHLKTPSLGDSNNNLYLESLFRFFIRVSCRGQGMMLHVSVVLYNCTTNWNRG